MIARTGPRRPGHQDGTYGHDGVALSQDEIAVRTGIFETVQRWKREVPGFENAYLMTIAPFLGSRGGPCIKGEHTVTPADMLAGRRFPDVLFEFGARGCFDPERPGTRVHSPWTDFPYRAMVPQKVEGLLAVGRSASGITDTLLRGRMMVMHMGQAGGTAAALAVGSGVSPRQLDVKVLQQRLLADGFFLRCGERLEELGIAGSA